MIEFCTKKRMGIAILFLIVISVIVLVFENSMSMDHDMKDVPSSSENGSDECLKGESYTVLKSCKPCHKLDMVSIPICTVSGYVELVHCVTKDGERNVSRSCPKLSWVDERNFWIFELLTALLGLGAFSVVHVRQRTLDRQLLEKVNKQIASGV